MHTPFDFDTPVDRRSTSSSKWNRYAGRDVIPLWVADMDFRCAPRSLQALRARVDQGVFGYTEPPGRARSDHRASLRRDYGWRIEPDWIVWLPSLVSGLNVVSRAFAEGRRHPDQRADLSAVPVGASERQPQCRARTARAASRSVR